MIIIDIKYCAHINYDRNDCTKGRPLFVVNDNYCDSQNKKEIYFNYVLKLYFLFQLMLSRIKSTVQTARRVTVDPVSVDDWEILVSCSKVGKKTHCFR